MVPSSRIVRRDRGVATGELGDASGVKCISSAVSERLLFRSMARNTAPRSVSNSGRETKASPSWSMVAKYFRRLASSIGFDVLPAGAASVPPQPARASVSRIATAPSIERAFAGMSSSTRIDTASVAIEIDVSILATIPNHSRISVATPQLYRAAYRFWLPTAMAFFVNGAAFGGWAAQIPRATARLQADEGAFGLMLLGMGIGAVLAMAFSARLIEKYGAGALIRLSLVVFLGIYIALSISSDWAIFVAALLLFGASGGLMDVAMNAYASDVEMHMNWRVMASLHGMWSIGGLAGAALASSLLAVVSDLTQALVLTAGISILFIACQHNLIPLQHRTGEKSHARLAIGRLTLILGVLAALSFSAEGAVRDWSSLFMTSEIRTGIDRAGWAFAAFSATMALCRFSGDWMRVRFGERNVIVISSIVAIIGFAMAVTSMNYLVVVAGFGVVGLGLSNIVPILISAAGRTSAPGSSIAFVVSFGYAGFLASPPVLGFIASQASLATMFAVVAASCIAIPLGWLLVERATTKA